MPLRPPAIALVLLLAIALAILGMTPPVALPVLWVPRAPALVGLHLVQAVVRIARTFGLLPAALALALARLRRTKPLLANLRTRLERLAARCAPAGTPWTAPDRRTFHSVQNEVGNRYRRANPTAENSDQINQGSIPMSRDGSTTMSAEELDGPSSGLPSISRPSGSLARHRCRCGRLVRLGTAVCTAFAPFKIFGKSSIFQHPPLGV